MRNRGRRVVEAAYIKIENAQKPDESRGQDVMLWKHNDYKDFFFSQRTWDQIRTRGPEVRWHSLVWFTQGVPRQSFIVN